MSESEKKLVKKIAQVFPLFESFYIPEISVYSKKSKENFHFSEKNHNSG